MKQQKHSLLQRTTQYTDTKCIHIVLSIPSNQKKKVTVELEHLALNYGTTEPQHYKKNCTLHRHNTYIALTIPSNHQTKVVVELEHLALNYGTAEPQQYKKNCTLLRDTIHTLYLR